MTSLWAALLAFVLPAAVAAEITLINDTNVDLEVEIEPGRFDRIPAGAVARVRFQGQQWVKFGREALFYSSSHFLDSTRDAVLQIGADGNLYCVPPGTSQAVRPIPKQPPQCPIRPSKRVSLAAFGLTPLELTAVVGGGTAPVHGDWTPDLS
jgi:hypothetical protein